jgi:hypothetical protein
LGTPALYVLDTASGPVFRFAFALLALGLARRWLFNVSNAIGGYVTEPRDAFWTRLRLRCWWFACPAVVLHVARPEPTRARYVYHVLLSLVALVFRACVIIVPMFLAAHVYLWERWLGVSWPALPGWLADRLTLTTIVAGVVLFLGRLYSPTLRKLDPSWSFVTPLLVLVPFITGILAMHPTWSPLDYYTMLTLHITSASLVFVLLPFTPLLGAVHTALIKVVPAAAWRAPQDDAPSAADRAAA